MESGGGPPSLGRQGGSVSPWEYLRALLFTWDTRTCLESLLASQGLGDTVASSQTQCSVGCSGWPVCAA